VGVVAETLDDLAAEPLIAAQGVLADLTAAGFVVLEAWRIDHDVLVSTFRTEKVVYEPTVAAWTVPTMTEARAMAAVVERALGVDEDVSS
jgi:hypothetical protein